ncbi:hypothetical protein AB6M97_02135 [Streptococcus hillyeri]|uniref:Uncharacterized protein n=1 Tax=Streptococcus hillyeri TaxID=2282420 RepID=A0A3L9DMJ8_9STRE|nr:hypothetical protein [Streptococcus hillyeri]RLY01418.1 hypothetical protein EAF07_09625 [Streptococcus hillyeri]
MYQHYKKPEYFKSVILGMTSMIFPTFFQVQDIPKINLEKLTSGQKVRLDYSKSVKEIKKEAVAFRKAK